MSDKLIATRYGQAAFELASEKGQAAEWLENLSLFKDAMDEPKVASFFSNPQISEKDKEEVIRKSFASFVVGAQNLILLLASKNLLQLAGDIFRHFESLYNQQQGLATAYVTTAVAMTPEEKSQVAAQLGATFNKTITPINIVDPGILGGMTARVGDKLIDGSLLSSLNELRTKLATG